MRTLRRVAVAGVAAAFIATSVEAAAQVEFSTCFDSSAQCADLEVPLDRAEPGGPTLPIALTRVRGASPGASPLVVLTGGPGQAGLGSLPGGVEAMRVLGRTTGGRDVISLDQRGTGLSALRCAAVDGGGEQGLALTSLAGAAAACAEQIGPSRTHYTTADTVEDLEQVRRALGLERWTMLGISYGSLVGSTYARAYPDRVERLVLDSPVPLEGESATSTETFTAARRVLADVCRAGACRGVTRNALADTRRLVQRLKSRSVPGVSVDARGRARQQPFGGPRDRGALLQALVVGDQNPTARAAYPAAVRAALRGDSSLLQRIVGPGGESSESPTLQSEALFLATICQESDVPWSTGQPAPARRAALEAALDAQPAGAYAPFTVADAWGADVWPTCTGWPEAETSRLPSGGIPGSVPTMVVVGTEDIRTPLEAARRISAASPSATVVPVRGAGHSVLSEERRCVDSAMRAFFVGGTVSEAICSRSVEEPDIVRVPPTGLAQVPPLRGLPPVISRTLSAALLAVLDSEVALGLGPADETTARGTGLRGGVVVGRLTGNGAVLRFSRYTYVPGVSVSGTLRNGTGRLRIKGAFAKGIVRIRPDGRLVGRLGGEPVSLGAGPVGQRLASLGAGHDPRSPLAGAVSSLEGAEGSATP